MRELFFRLINHGGPSTTKTMYIVSGIAAVVSVTTLTFGFTFVYVVHRAADLQVAGTITAIWGLVLGFSTRAQNQKNKADRDIAIERGAPLTTEAGIR